MDDRTQRNHVCACIWRAAVVTTLVSACDESQYEDAEKQDTPFLEAASESRDNLDDAALVAHQDAATRVVPLYPELTLETPYGGSIEFFVDPDDGGVVVAERGQIGDPSMTRDPRLAEASALDLFLAAVGDTQDPPAFLIDDYRRLHGIPDDVSVADFVPSKSERLDLVGEIIPQAAYSDCDANACLILGWDNWYCAFNVAANQTRNWVLSANDEGSNAAARVQASACHIGTASVNVEVGYRADSGEDCSGFTALYYTINSGGFSTISDHEYATYWYNGVYPRHWYLTKSTTTNGTTDLWLGVNGDCPPS